MAQQKPPAQNSVEEVNDAIQQELDKELAPANEKESFASMLAAVHGAHAKLQRAQGTYMALAGLAEGSRQAPVVDWKVSLPASDGGLKIVEIKLDLDRLSRETKQRIADELLASSAQEIHDALEASIKTNTAALARFSREIQGD